MLFEWLKITFRNRLNNTLNVVAHYLLILATEMFVTALLTPRHLRYKFMDQFLFFFLLMRVGDTQRVLRLGRMRRSDQMFVTLSLFEYFLSRAIFLLEGANIGLCLN